MNNSFRTYQNSNKFRISNGSLLEIILLGSLLILLLNHELSFLRFNFIEKAFQIIVIAFFVLIVYRFFKNFNEIEKLNGKVTGSVALFTEKILLNNQNIFLKDISLISLVVFDFSHRREVYLISTPYPSLSNGFGNILTIKLINGEIIETNFEQKYQEEFLRKNKEMLIDYYKMGKISLLNLLDVFGIDDYDDIQDFKKSVLKI